MGFILTAGEVLAEILADTPGFGFLEPQPLYGPFPSGAPAIFIDQVGKLGYPCGIIGAIGDDDFGHLNVARLKADNVDTSGLHMVAEGVTGTAFVRYRPDGNRNFVFNIAHSASGQLALTPDARKLLDTASHFHFMGSSVFSPSIMEAMRECIETAKANGATISFDPNIRPELLARNDILPFFQWVLDQTDIFLPSGEELFIFAPGIKDKHEAIKSLLGRGVKEIVLKNGADGAEVFIGGDYGVVPGLVVDEVDPTGAGDCFGATYVTCRAMNMDFLKSLKLANAAGSRQVTVRGPMEGTSSFDELNAWLQTARAKQ